VAQGTPQDPHLWGRIDARPSRGTLPGTAFNLRSFSLRHEIAPQPGERVPPKRLALTGHYSGFAEQTLPNVTVDGRSLGPVHLAMTIEGDLPQGPTVRVTAEPPLTQEQILALIGLEGLAPSGTTDLNELLSQRFVSLLATGFREALFEPIETQLKRYLGLEEFSVSFSFDQPLEVRLGKYLFRNFLVTYRYSLIGGRQEQWNLGVSYDLPQRYRVTYGSNESGEKQFRVTRQWAF